MGFTESVESRIPISEEPSHEILIKHLYSTDDDIIATESRGQSLDMLRHDTDYCVPSCSLGHPSHLLQTNFPRLLTHESKHG